MARRSLTRSAVVTVAALAAGSVAVGLAAPAQAERRVAEETIVVHGLAGTPIVVQGQNYSGQMPANADLTDVEMAAVLTYVRNSWGNADGMVLPDHVAEARDAGVWAP